MSGAFGSRRAQKHVAATGIQPVGAWPLLEGTGTAATADTSGNGHTGVLTNFSEANWDTMPDTGSNALRANAPDNRCIQTGVWVPTTGDLTVAALVNFWAQPSTANGVPYQTIIGQWDTGRNERSFLIDARTVGADTKTTISASITPNGTYTNPSFRHALPYDAGDFIPLNIDMWVVARYTQATGVIDAFINGVNHNIAVDQLNGATRVFPTTQTQVCIGSQYNSGALERSRNGYVGESRIYNVALTDQQIADWFTA